VRTTCGAAGSWLVAHAASRTHANKGDSARPSAIGIRMFGTRDVTCSSKPSIEPKAVAARHPLNAVSKAGQFSGLP